MPALALGVVHNEHMVGELLAEAELRLVLRLLLRMGSPGDLDIQHDKFSLFSDLTQLTRAAPPAPENAECCLLL